MGDIFQAMLDAFGYEFDVDMRDQMRAAVVVLLRDMHRGYVKDGVVNADEPSPATIYAGLIGIDRGEVTA